MACSCHCNNPHGSACASNEERKNSFFSFRGSEYISPVFAAVMLLTGFFLKSKNIAWFKNDQYVFIWYFIAFIAIAFPVLKESFHSIRKKDYFNEFTLMTIASVGAFYIGEYPEAVAVMLFYSIGELFQEKAVMRAKRNIRSLLDIRPQTATLIKEGIKTIVSPSDVSVGEIIEVKAGERVSLDGILIDEKASFNTSALTGESLPRLIEREGEVLAGMIVTDQVVRIKVTKPYDKSTLSGIINMVQNASEKKAKPELLMRRLARIYTPVVTALAFMVVALPFIYSLINTSFIYDFNEWLYRGLVFLVISCPCALVVSIPLGYFGGIGAASSRGILFKGGNYMDALTKIDTILFDKTGTLTKGSFGIKDIVTFNGYGKEELLSLAASAEYKSNHPLAKAIVKEAQEKHISFSEPDKIKEIAGYGIEAISKGYSILAGNIKLMNRNNISYPSEIKEAKGTSIFIAADNIFLGYISLSDILKEDAKQTINDLKRNGINNIKILSGDNKSAVDSVAKELTVSDYYGDLLPQDKAAVMENIRNEGSGKIAFVGDGINDAPILAMSDIGIAMGALGSDIAIETADVVIQTDRLSGITDAIEISKLTKRVVFQNIIMAFSIKIIVLLLGAGGIATLWEAVFADVGVALLAILNAVRIQWTYMNHR